MSFQGLTPEALVERSDSKNPATTCKGLTATGRPCRRALASSPNQSPSPTPRKDGNGVVAILDEGDAAAFFCWQHKDQAENLVAKLDQQRRTRILPLAKKSSVDTLIERVGILDLDSEVNNGQAHKHAVLPSMHRKEPQRVKKRDTLPQEWRAMHGPLMSVPEEVVALEMPSNRPQHHHRKESRPAEQRFGRSNVKASWSCCIRADDEDDLPPKRRNHRAREAGSSTQNRPQFNAHEKDYVYGNGQQIRRKPLVQPAMHQTSDTSRLSEQQSSLHRTPLRPSPHPLSSSTSPAHSETVSFLSLIPPHLSPTTTSALLAELSKPISDADEAGYIYIFWLTPESEVSKPDDETASSLLDDDDLGDISPSPSPRRTSDIRRQSGSRTQSSTDRTFRTNQALQRYASVKQGPSEPRKVLLKIGRANNVYRRLSQWTKQCGQNITLVRYYPYHRDTAAAQSSPAGPMVPHVHKVERLIHLELADQRAVSKGPCEQCGREHKEWFEVEATRQAVKAVDQTIRRWVAWAESRG